MVHFLLFSSQPNWFFPWIIKNLLLQGDSGGICNTLGNDSMCYSKQKAHMNMGPILNGYRDMVKRRYGPSCEHEQQLRNK